MTGAEPGDTSEILSYGKRVARLADEAWARGQTEWCIELIDRLYSHYSSPPDPPDGSGIDRPSPGFAA